MNLIFDLYTLHIVFFFLEKTIGCHTQWHLSVKEIKKCLPSWSFMAQGATYTSKPTTLEIWFLLLVSCLIRVLEPHVSIPSVYEHLYTL